jgi:hypothetical protein
MPKPPTIGVLANSPAGKSCIKCDPYCIKKPGMVISVKTNKRINSFVSRFMIRAAGYPLALAVGGMPPLLSVF